MGELIRNPAAEHAASGPVRVARLPPELANQIAAGEVVERPASVVKELVENSLDAGARRVVVTIKRGGRDLIQVRDDGCGMAREDALRAIERHATSKIAHIEDLHQIATLGFRGEAVPSIGSVSKMTIETKPHGELEGARVRIEGGMLREVETIGMKAGTSVRVEELFFNTPARLKFLKTPATETRHITEMLMRMGLSRPDVSFKLVKDGNPRLDMPAVEDLKDRILEVLGREVYDDLYATYEYPAINGVVARGYFSKPGHSQRTTRNLYAFVNGRYVNDRTIRAAVFGAYRQFLDKRRYPSVVLFVQVPFDLVDVNVHPGKTEVRFNDTQPIYRAVYHAIADRLAESPWLEDERSRSRTYELAGGGGEAWEPGRSGAKGRGKMVSPGMASLEPLNARHRRLSEQRSASPPKLDGQEVASPFFERAQQRFRREAAPLQEPPRVFIGEAGDEPPDATQDEGYFSSLRVIGQFKRAYIVCEDASGLVIIDQHAAHERIGFERLRGLYHSDHKETQPLLFPMRLELDALRADCMAENLDFFEEAGFEVEPFGGQTFALKAVPAVLDGRDHARIIHDALDDLSRLGRTDRVSEEMEAILSRMACHSVVRGPTPLSGAECEGLLVQMDSIDFKANCPHGRPVYYRIPHLELEECFDRR